MLLGQPACHRCHQRLRRNPQPCPSCAVVKVLAFHDTTGRAACAGCTGQPAIFGCADCGREDSYYGRRCAPCTLRDRVTEMPTAPDGQVHPQLLPVFEALLTVDRPQTTLYWLLRSTGPDILRQMAQGELAISHAAFAGMPSNRTVNYVRELLTALGVLPAHHAELERMTPWLAGLLSDLPKEHAELLGRFTNWQLLRRLRRQDDRGKLTHGAIGHARAAIIATITLLAWLSERDKTISAVTQTDVDHYLSSHLGQTSSLASFCNWVRSTGLNTRVSLPVLQRAQPQVTLSDSDRWEHVELLLHDDSIRLYTRIGGLLTLLFAQPLSRICRMREPGHRLGGAVTHFRHLPDRAPRTARPVGAATARPPRASLLRQPSRPLAVPWRHPRPTPGDREYPQPTRRPWHPARRCPERGDVPTRRRDPDASARRTSRTIDLNRSPVGQPGRP